MTTKVTLGKTVKVTTILVNILLAGTLVFTVREVVLGYQPVLMAIVSVGLLCALLLTPLFKPTHLVLADGMLVIRFPFHRICIPQEEIEAVEPREKYKGYANVRTFGSGPFWGYLGKFHNNGVGHYTAYAADLSHSFYLRLRSGKVYLLSCSRRPDFLKALARK